MKKLSIVNFGIHHFFVTFLELLNIISFCTTNIYSEILTLNCLIALLSEVNKETSENI